MQLRNLGDTGLSVTPVGLGLAALGRPGYINLGHADDLDRNYDVTEMERRTHNVLDEAWKLGVRYFDAARSYGKAEEFLSSWLRNRTIASGKATIGSKWGYSYTAGWKTNAEKHEVKEHTLPVLQKQWTESRDLPGYVVFSSGSKGPSGGNANWGSGFLPSQHQGVPFRRGNDPVLYLGNPDGVAAPDSRRTRDAAAALRWPNASAQCPRKQPRCRARRGHLPRRQCR